MFEDATTMSVATVGGGMSAALGTTSYAGTAVPAVEAQPTTRSHTELVDGLLIAGRYRILSRIGIGWAAEDERLCDAIVVGAEAFAIRAIFTP